MVFFIAFSLGYWIFEVCKRHWKKCYFVRVVMCWFYISRCLPFPRVDSPSLLISAGIARKFLGVGNRETEGEETLASLLYTFPLCPLWTRPHGCTSSAGFGMLWVWIRPRADPPALLHGMSRVPHVPPFGNL